MPFLLKISNFGPERSSLYPFQSIYFRRNAHKNFQTANITFDENKIQLSDSLSRSLAQIHLLVDSRFRVWGTIVFFWPFVQRNSISMNRLNRGVTLGNGVVP